MDKPLAERELKLRLRMLENQTAFAGAAAVVVVVGAVLVKDSPRTGRPHGNKETQEAMAAEEVVEEDEEDLAATVEEDFNKVAALAAHKVDINKVVVDAEAFNKVMARINRKEDMAALGVAAMAVLGAAAMAVLGAVVMAALGEVVMAVLGAVVTEINGKQHRIRDNL